MIKKVNKNEISDLARDISYKIHSYGKQENHQNTRRAQLKRCRQFKSEQKLVHLFSCIGHLIPKDIIMPMNNPRSYQERFLNTITLLAPIQAAIKFHEHDFGDQSIHANLGAILISRFPVGSEQHQPIERRFTTLLKLPVHQIEKQLFALLTMARNSGQSKLDWPSLYMDIFQWNLQQSPYHQNSAQVRWARSFFSPKDSLK